MYKFISLKKSTDGVHKYEAIIYNETTKRNNTVKFGAVGYDDYTTTKDEERKKLYIARHEKRENWGKTGINTAGFWSKHILWNKKTISGSVADMKKMFFS